MNYHRYYPIDVVNGLGTRCTLFVSGCIHKCRGCYNATTWNPLSGQPFTQSLADRIISDLNNPKIPLRGISLTGGDPLYPENIFTIKQLIQRIKKECLKKDIWLWTGYTIEELSPMQIEVVELLDVMIDGKYIEALKDPNLLWRGSSNQRIITNPRDYLK